MAKVFRAAEMMSEDVQSYVISCQYQENSKDAPIADGSFVKLGELKEDKTYVAAGDKDYNVYLASEPTAVTDKVVVIDYPGVSEGTISGNSYRMGVKLFDLVAPAGRPVRARRLALGDRFWLGEGNFTGAVGSNGFATLTANDVRLTPAGAAGDNFAVKIHLGKDFNYGQSASGKLYLCEVIGL
ncbi:hypothetical protein [uncultured Streptococcus sp.]|uniref:hypothetical protein n=1 Tax=uncultured Streptococcus sp. TaxID=83427 RepID=UPI0025F290D8|nr:hypothetical protein [uncultured Streptococcus sp.]